MQLTNNIKRIFLSFAQEYFRDVHPTLRWNVDPKITKIFIGDKYIAAPAVYERTPSILLSRGPASFVQSSIDQMQSIPGGLAANSKLRTDLVRGSVAYHCISQNGVEAEEMANVLFHTIVGSKDNFRSHGIHQILGVSMSEENLVRGDVVPRLVDVTVNVIFTTQVSLLTIQDFYSVQVFTDDTQLGNLINTDGTSQYAYQGQLIDAFGKALYTNETYGYTLSGLTMIFNYAPKVGTNIRVNYTGAITATQYRNVVPSGIIDGSNNIFTLSELAYTSYATFSGLSIYVNSGITGF